MAEINNNQVQQIVAGDGNNVPRERNDESERNDRKRNSASVEGGDKKNENGDGNVNKRLRIQQPDLTVVVGEKSFQHYSVLLCAASPYIDVMLSGDMREAMEMTIRFPDKSPEEWELVCQYLQPCTGRPLTTKEIPIVLPWFHELQIDKMVEECGRLIYESVKPISEQHCRRWNGAVNEFLVLLELSEKYSLQAAKTACLDGLEYWIRRGHVILGSNGVSRLIPFLWQRESLWNQVKRFLPKPKRNSPREDLLGNELFSDMVSARWNLRALKKKTRRQNQQLDRSRQLLQSLRVRQRQQRVAGAAADNNNRRPANVAARRAVAAVAAPQVGARGDGGNNNVNAGDAAARELNNNNNGGAVAPANNVAAPAVVADPEGPPQGEAREVNARVQLVGLDGPPGGGARDDADENEQNDQNRRNLRARVLAAMMRRRELYNNNNNNNEEGNAQARPALPEVGLIGGRVVNADGSVAFIRGPRLGRIFDGGVLGRMGQPEAVRRIQGGDDSSDEEDVGAVNMDEDLVG